MNFGIEWCGICNSAPADGTLEIVEKSTGERITLNACNYCVDKIKHNESKLIENGLNHAL